MAVDNFAGDCETKAGSAGVGGAGVVQPNEWPKCFFPLIRWNTGAIVVDGDFEAATNALSMDLHLVAITGGVGDKVGDGTAERVAA